MNTLAIRISYLLVSVGFYLLTRYHEGISSAPDLPLFHNVPNLLTVFICAALMGALYGGYRLRDLVGVTFGLIIYEFMQVGIAERTFDWLDIAATLVGMGLYWAGRTLLMKTFGGLANSRNVNTKNPA